MRDRFGGLFFYSMSEKCDKCGWTLENGSGQLLPGNDNLFVCEECFKKYAPVNNQPAGTDFYTAQMQDGDIDTLARLLVRHHNTITQRTSSFYGEKMDKALCRDTLSTLFTKVGMYDRLLEIQSHFIK